MFQGQRLRELRLKNKYTHERLANLLDINIRMVTRYETEKIDAGSSIVVRMADVFGVSTDYLLGRTDDPTPPSNTDLSDKEKEVIAALRRDDAIGAIKAIVTDL